MRRVVFIWLIAILVVFSISGKPVTQEEIRLVVQVFTGSVFPSGNHYEISQIIPVQNGSDIPVYIVNLKPGGWVLLTGDDKATPVLGYSVTGSLDSNFPKENAVDSWMNYYAKSMVPVINDKSLIRNTLWNGTAGPYRLKSASSITVEPMISVKWDQDKTWNWYCPADVKGPDGHTYVGCVGVCMAQAMSFYHYPLQGTGSKTYFLDTYGTIIVHYDRESPYQWDSMALDAADKYNARLLYHCAVSVGMQFGADGSSAQTRNIPAALSKYFKYYSGAKYIARYDNDSTWTALLVSELAAGRPLIYSGFPQDNNVGHAFDIDGVDSRGYFHVNWGWNGKYNGYYLINNLHPGTNNFTRDQGAVINIRPPVYRPTDLDLTRESVKEGMPSGTFVGLLKITDEARDNEYIFRVKRDSLDGDSTLSSDFYIVNDSLKTSKVFLYNEQNEYTIYISVTDKFDHTYQEKFRITILAGSTVTGYSDINDRGIEVFPNPSDGDVIIKNPVSGKFSVDVTDQTGRRITHAECDGSIQILHLNSSSPGIYFLQIHTANGNQVTRKLVIR
jgi:hypothetical protein